MPMPHLSFRRLLLRTLGTVSALLVVSAAALPVPELGIKRAASSWEKPSRGITGISLVEHRFLVSRSRSPLPCPFWAKLPVEHRFFGISLDILQEDAISPSAKLHVLSRLLSTDVSNTLHPSLPCWFLVLAPGALSQIQPRRQYSSLQILTVTGSWSIVSPSSVDTTSHR